MKKILYFTVISVFGLVSCAKELENENVAPLDQNLVTLSATLSNDDDDTKTTFKENKSLWCADDQISVLNGESNKCFSVQEKASYVSSKTAKFEGEDFSIAEAYYAVYPYNSGVALADGVITGVVLPQTQEVATDGTFADGAALSVARSEDKSSMSFKNVATVLKFTLSSAATSVEFVANGGESVAGTIDVTYDGTSAPTYSVQSGKSSVTVTGSFAAGKTYYFTILPDVTLSKGYTFKVGGKPAKITSASVKLERSKVYNVSGDLQPMSDTKWYIKGSFNNWGTTVPMYKENGLLVAKNVNLSTANARKGFKFSYDGVEAWGTTVGAAGKDAAQVKVDLASWYLAKRNRHDDYNADICLADYTQTYDIYLEPTHHDFYVVKSGSKAPASIVLSGDCNAWAEEAMEYKNGFFVAKNKKFSANQSFKFRKSGSWDVAFAVAPWDAAQTLAKGVMTSTVPGGNGNILVPAAGTYDIYISENYAFCMLVDAGTTPNLTIPAKTTVTIYCKNNDEFKDRANLWAWSVVNGTTTNWSSNWPGPTKSSETHWIGGSVYYKWVFSLNSSLLGNEARFIFTKNGGENTPKDGAEDSFILHSGMILNLYDGKVYADSKALF